MSMKRRKMILRGCRQRSLRPASQQLRYTIRAARADDMSDIKKWISQEKMNPLGLNWRNFVVAMSDDDGSIIGCAQIKTLLEPTFADGFFYLENNKELSSVFVRPEFRGRGVGTAMVQKLVEGPPAPVPLFLTCPSSGMKFYEQFGFSRIPEDDKSIPFLLKAEVSLGKLASKFLGGKGPSGQVLDIVLMKIEDPEAADLYKLSDSGYERIKRRSSWR
mmetsp:Transcript_36941/g.59773  ORF Transcript_36941/g.59773 Transcript_36941/m.59773 type:complete len:218 (+) Transcript_36941:335-988(+)